MILFKDLDWYQQCIYKMEYFLKEIEILKQKESFELFDQIRLNTLLNIIKSPMEYATLALTKSVSNKSNAFVPFRKNNFDDKNFRKIIKEKIGYVDDDIFRFIIGCLLTIYTSNLMTCTIMKNTPK